MTDLLPEFSSLRVEGVFDCELVAFGNDGKPSFHRLCQRMLNKQAGVAVAPVVFDVLALHGELTIALPYAERRVILESLTFGRGYHVSPSFDDGAALWRAVREHRLEGIVAKKLNDPYKPGERGWIKKKNPDWPRYQAEREAAMREGRKRR